MKEYFDYMVLTIQSNTKTPIHTFISTFAIILVTDQPYLIISKIKQSLIVISIVFELNQFH